MQDTKRVKNPGKQRKKVFNAPAHLRHKLMAAPLSNELAASRGAKTLPVRKGDTVRVQRGDNKGFEGKVSRVDLKEYRVYLEGLTREKVDGTNIFIAVHPSKVQIRNLNLDDKWRKNVLGRKKEIEKPKAKPAKKAAKAPEKLRAKVEEAKEAKPIEAEESKKTIPKVEREEAPSEKVSEKKAEKSTAKAVVAKKPAAKKPIAEKEVVQEKKAPAKQKATAKKVAKPKTAESKSTSSKKEAPAKEMAAKEAQPKSSAKSKASEENKGGQ
jgi:large subunit ribosomal protein L24